MPPATTKSRSRLDQMVAATPASRDRYVDFLRAASIVVVVVGHWTISIIAWDGGVIRSTSALGLGTGLWLATWLFQVMPVFFFVGGYSNLVAYESSRPRGSRPGRSSAAGSAACSCPPSCTSASGPSSRSRST
ncbi:MAG: acyltransferase family protein [Acidimicrobiia bacterium]